MRAAHSKESALADGVGVTQPLEERWNLVLNLPLVLRVRVNLSSALCCQIKDFQLPTASSNKRGLDSLRWGHH